MQLLFDIINTIIFLFDALFNLFSMVFLTILNTDITLSLGLLALSVATIYCINIGFNHINKGKKREAT